MTSWLAVEYCWCSVDMRTYCAARRLVDWGVARLMVLLRKQCLHLDGIHSVRSLWHRVVEYCVISVGTSITDRPTAMHNAAERSHRLHLPVRPSLPAAV